VTSLSVLEREMYSEAEAARLLGVAQSTLNYWLEGGERRGKSYPPVIRPEPHGRRAPVTWAEFVEAGLLRSYRRDLGVKMAELRAFIDQLRNELGVPYPLADRRPYVSNKELVFKAQQETGLDTDLWLVTAVGGQYQLLPPSDEFVRRVTWADDVVASWRPADSPESTVRINPELRFGKPAVAGISTEAIWEHSDAGEDEDEIAETFGLSLSDVRWALSYETARRAA
jgi:uncharacterized protein (DUF433 family)/transposase